jgi:murein DD-endopeptidase MepM/ murein hydrolase activator NlpD
LKDQKRKQKYYYDPDTLSYRKVASRPLRKLWQFGLFFMASALSGAAIFYSFNQLGWVRNSNEIVLQRELDNYKQDYQNFIKRLDRTAEALENLRQRDNEVYRLYFEMDPIPEEQYYSGFGGVNRYRKYEGQNNSDLIKDAAQSLDVIEKAIVNQSRSLDDISEMLPKRKEYLAAIPTIQPVKNEDLRRMASGYGWRSDPFTKMRKFHYGMDFSAPVGTPIFATGDGVVKRADQRASGLGKHIRIDHGFGYVTIFGHLSKYNVRRGQKVKRGDIIGYVGNTGRSLGSHLHYEVHKDRKQVNPIDFYAGTLSAADYEILSQRAALSNQSLD